MSGVAMGTRRVPAMLRWAGIGLCLIGLGACTNLLPGQGAPPRLYTLSPKSIFDPDLPRVDWQLVVEVPVAAGGLETTRIALKSDPIELQYFADARWAEAAPSLVQTLVVESFENTGKIVAVGRQAIGLRSDFNLKSELREFQAEYFDGADVPVIRVTVNAKVIRQPRCEIIASETFQHEAPASGESMSAVIAAFDDALGKVLKHIVEWTLRTAR